MYISLITQRNGKRGSFFSYLEASPENLPSLIPRLVDNTCVVFEAGIGGGELAVCKSRVISCGGDREISVEKGPESPLLRLVWADLGRESVSVQSGPNGRSANQTLQISV